MKFDNGEVHSYSSESAAKLGILTEDGTTFSGVAERLSSTAPGALESDYAPLILQ